MKQSIANLVELWPQPQVTSFAQDIGVKPSHVGMMKIRNAIHVRHWPKLVKAAERRGLKGIDYNLLVSLHSEQSA